MAFIPERFIRYKGYVLPPFPSLRENPSEQLDKIRTFNSRDSDILICTYPKSGTNWVHEIISMIVKSRAEYNVEYKSATMLETMSNVENVPESPTRILNSHLPFAALPEKHIKNGYKVVHVIRNPKDVAVSLYNHFSGMKDLVTMKPNTDYPISWPLFIEHFCRGDEELYNGWFEYEKAFEKAKETGELSNVFTTEYEQLKKDPLSVLKALATFLGVQATEELLLDIIDKCSFEKLSTKGTECKDNTLIKKVSTTGKNFLFRKGQIGDWKNWFTVAQNEAFNQLIETEMKDSKLELIYD